MKTLYIEKQTRFENYIISIATTTTYTRSYNLLTDQYTVLLLLRTV